jgi:ATP-dependent helicase Lhr and Lhr-like helicase
VNNFELLHPALQHHIVNNLGWRDMRPFQDAVIPEILAGKHLIIIAPTAGGKTEAAFFPVVSRMLADDWRGLSVIYVCPIKALLNNLDVRLQRYCSLVGRRSALWHGDVKAAARKRIVRDPPDCLLTTPESLEAILVSSTVNAHEFFRQVKVIIVDEVHAFAGDDRGWHLLFLLERISRLAGCEIQRLGLSATVGSPETLITWLAGTCQGERGVFSPKSTEFLTADVKLDYVGSLENAATVISRLHKGEKRLVFVDSRSRAEQLGSYLHQGEVTTFVSHSSLSEDQRRQAEQAFASGENCVIVATSALELGIDVGDLDRVIQIDAPSRVSSFLQRMGRSGRREGRRRNCLFLATNDESLIRAAGLIDLWAQDFVEAVTAPPKPYHIVAQQLMALALQERGIGRRDWASWIEKVVLMAGLTTVDVDKLIAYMLEVRILSDDQGVLWLGAKGEENYGRRHFMKLLSVFATPPLFLVLHGHEELGFVDEITFLGKTENRPILLLGGRPWQVNHIDWQKRLAYVEATGAEGKSHWQGEGQALGYELCQSIKGTLVNDSERECWSRRARERIANLRREYPWIEDGRSAVVTDSTGSTRWWTFAGSHANATIAAGLGAVIGSRLQHDSFSVGLGQGLAPTKIEHSIAKVRSRDLRIVHSEVNEQAIDDLKFSECLPREVALGMLRERLTDCGALDRLVKLDIRFVRG